MTWLSKSLFIALVLSLPASAILGERSAQANYNNQGWRTAALGESDVLANMRFRREFLQTQKEKLDAEWDNVDWSTSIKSYFVENLPFVSWWRQAHAMDRAEHWNFLPGSTINGNIQYMYSLPLPEMKQTYNHAMQYFHDRGDVLGAIDFTQALLSYSTLDENWTDLALGIRFLIWSALGVVVIREIKRRHMLNKFKGLARRAHSLAGQHAPLVGVTGLGMLTIGFLASDGYNSHFGLLGSLSRMTISAGLFIVPFRLVAAVAVLLLLYAGYLFACGQTTAEKVR